MQTATRYIFALFYKYTTPGSGCQYLTNAKGCYFIYFNTNDKKIRQKKPFVLIDWLTLGSCHYRRNLVFRFQFQLFSSLSEFAQFEPAHGLFVNERNDILYAARFCNQFIVAQCAAAQRLLNG